MRNTLQSIEKMFDDSEIKVIKFDSCIEDKRLFVESSSQTENNPDSTIEAQTTEITSTGVQVTSDDKSNSLNISFAKNVENVGLFLKNILPCLYDELQNYSDDDYLKLHKKLICNNKENEKFEMSDDLAIPAEIVKEVDFKDALVSHLAWNSNGMLLGIAFSKKIHEGWCNHEVGLSLYSVSKNKFEAKPFQIIKSTSCIKQIQFHPFIPSILAGGFQNGEVLIWVIKNADIIPFFKLKENEEECHVEAVTFLGWKENESNLILVTAGKDGKILFWKVLLNNLTYTVYKRFVILGNNEIQVLRMGSYVEDLHIGFWSDNEDDFIATADEKIFHCSLRNNDNDTVSKYNNPTCFNYMPHKGIITRVACLSQSMFFATCAMDGEIRIYLPRNKTPIFLLCPKNLVIGIMWIGIGSQLISWGQFGMVECHKFNVSDKTYVSSVLYNVGKNISAVGLNPTRKESIAFGCENGEVVISHSFLTL